MNTWRTVLAVGATATALAGVAAPSVLATAGEPELGTTTTVAAAVATSVPGGEFVLPPGFGPLVDDTNRITVSVPDTWTDIDTAPRTVDGALVPTINAATDLQVWDAAFDAPGVLYAAFPFIADPQTLLDRYGLSSGCAANTVVPYSDGVFTGSWGQWTQCGATGQAEWHLIVASPADQEFTALVITQLTGPQDQQAFDIVRETFNVTPQATWPASAPGSTVPATSGPVTTTVPVPLPPTTSATPATSAPHTTSPVTTVPLTTTATSVALSTVPASTVAPPAGVRLVDETNLLTVTVPGDWLDQNLSNSRHDDGSERATITASPSIDDYFSTWDVPGVHLVAVPAATDPAALLTFFGFPNACTDGGVTPYDDGRLVGQQQTWLDCGGTSTRVVNVAARPIDNSFTLFIQVQQPVADDAALIQIVGSAGAVPGATYPTPVSLPPLTPTGAVPPELLVTPAVPLATVADEQGRLAISVPSAWTDTDVLVHMNDDGTERPHVAAAPVLDSFYTDWTAPGVQVVAYPFTSNPSVLLQNLGFAGQCTDGGVQTFDNGTFTGLMQTWTACGRTASRNVLLAVSPADQSVTVYIEVQLPDADNTPLQAVLSSLRVG
jgi:hypothetical protein